MDEAPVKEVLDELFSLLETLETQGEAVLQYLKDERAITDDKFAPYLERAGRASNTKWRAARARMEYLFNPIKKEPEEDKERSSKKEPEETKGRTSQKDTEENKERTSEKMASEKTSPDKQAGQSKNPSHEKDADAVSQNAGGGAAAKPSNTNEPDRS